MSLSGTYSGLLLMEPLRCKRSKHGTTFAVQVNQHQECMMPTAVRTEPTALDKLLLRHAATHLPQQHYEFVPDVALWQLLAAAAAAARPPPSADAGLLTCCALPAGIDDELQDAAEAPAEPAAADAAPQTALQRAAAAARDAPSRRLRAKLAAAEALLQAKAHSLLGVGSESSGTFYAALARHLPGAPRRRAAQLTAFVAPLLAHDTRVWTARRGVWEARDAKLATQMLLHHLAVQLHRERPEFTLGFDDGDLQVRL